jgi:uncharacterized membrane-anchored protein
MYNTLMTTQQQERQMTVTQYLVCQGYGQEEIRTILEEMEYQRQQELWVAADPYGQEPMDWDAFDHAQVDRLWPEAEEIA